MFRLLGVLSALAFIGVNLPAGPPALLIDLAALGGAQTGITRVYGSTGSGQYGVPVCGGFDCNGDGFKDAAFSQMVADPLGRIDAGMVTLMFLNGHFGTNINTAGFTNTVLKIIGDANQEITGSEIWMDDINADGLGDLLIGRQNFTPAPGRDGAGAVSIILGTTNLSNAAAALNYFDLRNPPAGVPVVTLVGERAYDRLGIWLRTGDVDGDGIVDMVVGADEHENATNPLTVNSGAIYVLRGGSHWTGLSGTVDFADFGTTNFNTALESLTAKVLPPNGLTNSHFGATCTIGDLDGNGRGEVLACAALNRAGAGLRLANAPNGTGLGIGGLGSGTMFIAWDENFPEGPWPMGYTFRIDQPRFGDFTRIDGSSTNMTFGEEMFASADFSADGFTDLFVGDLTGTGPNGALSGLGYVIWNAASLRGLNFNIAIPPTNLSHTVIHGPSSGAIGADTVAAGDFDNDGIEDLAIGNPHDSPQGRPNAGSVHILFGQGGGWPEIVDLKASTNSSEGLPLPTELRVTQIDAANGTSGINRPDTLCYSAAAGDLNGDGFDDLIANEMVGDGISPGTTDVGNLLLISGASLRPIHSPELTTLGDTLNFGARPLNSSDLITLAAQVRNVTGNSISIAGVTIEGPKSGAFSLHADTGQFELTPGATRTIIVRFHPTSLGPAGATLRVHQTGTRLPVRFRLIAEVYDPAFVPTLQQRTVNTTGDYLSITSQRGMTFNFLLSTDLRNWPIFRKDVKGTGGSLLVPRQTQETRGFYRSAGLPK